MKVLRRLLLPLCTLCLVVLGAAMPWLSARMEDQRADGFREEFDLNVLSLTLREESGAADALRLLSGPCGTFSWEGETVLDLEGVRKAAFDISTQLVEDGLMDGKYALSSSFAGEAPQPLLVLSEDGSRSAIVWYYIWGEDGSQYFVIDDATGKLVGGLFRRSGKLKVPYVNKQVADWVQFCEAYYGAAPTDFGWVGGHPLTDGELIGGSTFVLTLQPPHSELFEVRIVFYELTFEFNSPMTFTDAGSMLDG